MIDPMQALADAGAIITNSHVVYASGRHGSEYVNKDALYLHPRLTYEICANMAAGIDPDAIDVVAGPAIGGALLAQGVAWHLSQRRSAGEALAVFAEEVIEGTEKRRVFRRGYDAFVRGARVLVVEDVVNSGGTVENVIQAVRELGGTVAGLQILCNRGDRAAIMGVPMQAQVTVALASYPEDDCPLCASGVPINTTVGKGAAFLARRQE
jgi:orotate phosphoribosyltransferase